MSVTVNLPSLKKLKDASEYEKRQAEVAMRAEQMMRKYVPRDEGTLRASAQLSSDFAAGVLSWTTPYAATQYSKPMTHSEPGTCDHWDEAFKRNDMDTFTDYVKAMYEECGL